MTKTIKSLAIKHGIGLLILIGVLFVIKFINVPNLFIAEIINFFRQNVALLIVITILHFLADLFELFSFPVSIPFPLFKSFAVTAGVVFIFNMIEAAVASYSLLLALKITSIAVHAYRITFIITLIISIITLFKNKKKSNN